MPDIAYSPSFRRAFRAKYTEDGPTNPILGQCWLWLAGKYGSGYGAFRNMGAHVVSYRLNVGEIAKGMFVCHHCDTRLCINPKHLFLGTQKQNMGDMVSKGREAHGERNGNVKLSAEQVIRARELRSKGYTYKRIIHKLRLPVTIAAIRFAIIGNTWRSVDARPVV